MTQPLQLGRPYEVKSTTPSLTITDVVDAQLIFNPTLHEHHGGKSRYATYTIGDDDTRITLKTTDSAALGWITGMTVSAVSISFAATETEITALGAQGATITQAAGTIVATVSSMKVISPVKVSNGCDGKPAEFDVEFKACQSGTGADPTMTFDLVLST